jgi:hypothetical protein
MSGSSTAYTGLGYARLTLGWKLSRWVDAGVNVAAGATTARVQIRFAGTRAGEWGMPVLAAGLFAGVGWH